MAERNERDDCFDRYRLAGKTAIITGGGSGIGRAVALDFARFSAKTLIADAVPGDAVVDEIRALGEAAACVRVDVRDRKAVQKVVDFAVDKFGTIDILINCAAVPSAGKIVEMEEDDWDRTIDVNLKGIFFCAKAVAPVMMARKKGSIISIGSASSRGPVFNSPQGGPDYCVSKSGVHALTRVLAWELAPYGIKVNTVAPGPVATPWHKDIKLLEDRYLSKIPLQRLGKAEDISNLVMFLASDAASYITGQAIHVNGGMLMVD